MATRLDGKMILWTALLVVAVGFVGTLTMLSPPTDLTEAPVRAVISEDAVVPAGRGPASINHAVQLEAMSLGGKENLQAVDLTIPCDGIQKTVFTHRVRQLRVKGEACQEKSDRLYVSVIQNAANGFVATVFFPTALSFTTDYISLADGINRIVIRHHYANGKIEDREYVVEREIQQN